jgi:Ion channel
MLLLSLVFLLLIHPLLDHSLTSRIVLGLLVFVPLVLAAVKLWIKRLWLWILAFVVASSLLIAGNILGNQILLAIHWYALALLFGLAVAGLFGGLRRVTAVTPDHLFTAATVYLLLAAMWFTLYRAVETLQPGSFEQTLAGPVRPPIDLLYFSLATLTTLGYGDIVPVGGEVRMLAALESAVGVLYVAITVAVLVSAYKPRSDT